MSGGRSTVGRQMRAFALCVLVAFLVLGTARASALVATTTPSIAWGLAGDYTPQDLGALSNRGLRLGLVEMAWSSAQPQEGAWSETYFASIRSRIAALRRNGFHVVLNFGLQEAPTWLLAKPDARFVNQQGTVFSGDAVANLVFALNLRGYAESYTAKVFRELGTAFYAVRVGGLHWGELAYPYRGRGTNDYWAFDRNALRARAGTPFARYVPCSGSVTQARGFASWYLDRLVDFQNWQVRMVRRSYPGPIAVLYPSHGIASGDAALAARANLCGGTPPEVNGELQRGIDHAREIDGLPRLQCLAAWSTWADNASAASTVFVPAARRGLMRMGENSGDDRDATAMRNAVANATRFRLSAFMWIRLDGSEPGVSTIDRFRAAIAALGGPGQPAAAPTRNAKTPCAAHVSGKRTRR
jgi:glycosyl hydrolase family 42 (putative beta-galactosidase)